MRRNGSLGGPLTALRDSEGEPLRSVRGSVSSREPFSLMQLNHMLYYLCRMHALSEDRPPERPDSQRKHLLVLGIYLLLSLVLTYPLIVNFNSALLGDGDAWLFVWNFWWWRFALASALNPFCTDYIHFPTGICAYLHTWNFANTWPTLPLQWLFSVTTLYNLCAVMSYVFAAWGMFRLARHLSLNTPAAFLAGLAFSFNAYHYGEANGHLNLVTYQWIPFFLDSLMAGLEGWTLRRVAGATFWLTVVALSDWYYLLFCVLGAGALVFARLTLDRRQALKGAGGVVLVGALCFLLLSPLLVGMIREAGGVPQDRLAATFSPDLVSFVVPPPTTSYSTWLRRVGNWWATYTSEASTPWSLLLIAPLGLVMLRGWNLRWISIWIAVFFMLSLGPVLHVAGHTMNGILLPYGWLEKIPVFFLARTPIRLQVMTWVGLSLLYALGTVRLSGKRPWLGMTLFGALFLLETLSIPVGLSRPDISPFYRDLAGPPGRLQLIDLHYNSKALFYQTVHHQKIMGLPSIVSRQTFEALRFLQQTPGVHQLVEENQLRFFVNATPREAVLQALPSIISQSSLMFAGYSERDGEIRVASSVPHRLQVENGFFDESRETIAPIARNALFVVRLTVEAADLKGSQTPVRVSINGKDVEKDPDSLVRPILPTVRIPLEKTGMTCLVYPNALVDSSVAADLERIKQEGFDWIIVPFYGNDHYVRAMGLKPTYRDRWLSAYRL
jgi:hypothetical protein